MNMFSASSAHLKKMKTTLLLLSLHRYVLLYIVNQRSQRQRGQLRKRSLLHLSVPR